jgi:hypothetical protein
MSDDKLMAALKNQLDQRNVDFGALDKNKVAKFKDDMNKDRSQELTIP